jgi:hypothetical protein
MWQCSSVWEQQQQINIAFMKKSGEDQIQGVPATILFGVFLSPLQKLKDIRNYNFICCFLWV